MINGLLENIVVQQPSSPLKCKFTEDSMPHFKKKAQCKSLIKSIIYLGLDKRELRIFSYKPFSGVVCLLKCLMVF